MFGLTHCAGTRAGELCLCFKRSYKVIYFFIFSCHVYAPAGDQITRQGIFRRQKSRESIVTIVTQARVRWGHRNQNMA